MSGKHEPRWRVMRLLFASAVLAGLLSAVAVPGVQAAPSIAEVKGVAESVDAKIAVASQFNAGFIVTDQNFFDGNAMTVDQIQAFLNAKRPTCATGYTCLKSYSDTTRTIPATPMCRQYDGGGVESAALIIWKVAQACGISPKTLLVTLQKEQGLVTATAPTAGRYQIAMGYACPDTAPCATQYYGFFNQVFSAAYQFRRYTQPPGTGAGTPYTTRFDLSYPVGRSSAVNFHPNAGCGQAGVFIQNQATHALYLYTPYVPNQAAMDNLYGSAPPCGSYGNRNFFVYWSDWFGSPTNSGSPYGEITATSAVENGVTIHGWIVDPDSAQNSNNALNFRVYVDGVDSGPVYTANKTDTSIAERYAYFGTNQVFDDTVKPLTPGLHTVCVGVFNIGANGQNVFLPCVSVTVGYCGTTVECPIVDRLSGATRYSQAVEISTAAFPSGASTVYVATGENYPDALSAAPLAARDGAPLLLTAAAGLPTETAAEIRRLGATRIVVVGGVNSVSAAVVDSLSVIAPTTRIAGADRYAVSRSLASEFGDSVPDLYVATGMNYPDALSADSVGAYQGRPVLLVAGLASTLDAETRDFLTNHGVQRVTIVGGPNSVTTGLQADIDALPGVTVTRLTGADRFEASHAANRAVFTSATRAYVATGVNFPDALAGSVLAARSSAPMFLVPGYCIPASITRDLNELGVDRLTILGGVNSVTDRVALLTRC